MATVYLADDIKHDRKVAVKVLRPELAAVIGAERFLAEIKTTANLQHPHILPLFDSGEADSFLFYVMPYVEGISLRDRMTREKQLPINEAVRIATEIASALDYAHRHGVIHRDIKPENIMLHDGSALVADFGIALAASKAGTRMTETGMSLGTPQYMSPEQAMGERELDARSDVYALGCVTYEMLTGEPPFSGPTAQAIVAKVMTAEPAEVTSLRKTIPGNVADAVHTALQKLPADRFPTAAGFAAALAGRTDGTRSASPSRAMRASATPARRPLSFVVAAAGVGVALGAGWLIRGATTRTVTEGPTEFAFQLGDGGGDETFVTNTPDGRRIAQVVSDSTGTNHVVSRDLGSTAFTTIAGTDGAEWPRFSHDGHWLAYEHNGKVYKVPSAGGPAVALADTSNAGSDWTVDDASLVYTRSNDGLWIVPAAGGASRQLTKLDTARHEFEHWYPQALPGGHAVLFTSYATPFSQARIEAVDLASGRRTVLVTGAVFARYVAGGYLLFTRESAIFAVRFNPSTLKVTGEAVPLVEDVAWEPFNGSAAFAVSDNGTLVYLKASEWHVARRVIFADRAGIEEAVVPAGGSWAQPRLSPDGKWIALTQTEPKRDLFLFDRGRRVMTQLTRAQGANFDALWMPDSRSVLYVFEDPVYDLHRISIDASTPDAEVLKTPYDKRPLAITPDGRTLAYTEVLDHDRLQLMPLAGGASTPIDGRGGGQRSGSFSPDGRWIAYEESNANESAQVYVRALDGHGGRVQVSSDGGQQPRWTKDGKEIVYRKGDAIFAASFAQATGAAGSPQFLFRKPDAGRLDSRSTGYDVTPDGLRFLMVVPVPKPAALPTHVILNWTGTLEKRVPR